LIAKVNARALLYTMAIVTAQCPNEELIMSLGDLGFHQGLTVHSPWQRQCSPPHHVFLLVLRLSSDAG
jgi:hypothetical protein